MRRGGVTAADMALGPVWLVLLVAYVGASLWTLAASFTNSRSLPSQHFIGLAQYRRLWLGARWPAALEHLLLFGVGLLVFTLAAGVLLALVLDRARRGEGLFRTVFLYPAAVSFVVTGLVFQWLMNPQLGLQAMLDRLGAAGVRLDWASHPHTVLLALIVAGGWQGSGLVMAITLASLRSINPEILSAARIDSVPGWRIYAQVVLPMIRPALLSAALIVMVNAVRVYDLVVAFTHGGPGTASDMPSLYIMDYLFLRQNIALACAASVSLLALVGLAVLAVQAMQRLAAPAART